MPHPPIIKAGDIYIRWIAVYVGCLDFLIITIILTATDRHMCDLVNLATEAHGCRVLGASSSQNPTLHPPSTLISPSSTGVWISRQGLPQSVTLSREEVDVACKNISEVGFVCAHDYDTNPQSIEIWVSKDAECAENGQFVHWETIELKRKRGKQVFSI
jgi:hypothetical protein